jgi:hypothetical protein
MNALKLQDAIVNDLQKLFSKRKYLTPDGETAAVSVFAQNLPKRDSEDDDDPFPYIIVRLDSGDIENQTSDYKVSVFLLVGVFDDSKNNQGHKTVLEMIELIQRHYEETPLLDGQFVFTDPFHWALQDEESYPFFFGGVEISFSVPAPRRKWSDLV